MTNTVKNRPVSPHLQIYRPIPTMVASILHRITGGALYFGTLLVAWWLVAIVSGESYYNFVMTVYGSLPGRLVLFGYTLVLVHHMLGGIRHLVWDTGRGFEKHLATRIAKVQFVASPVITVIIWIIGYAAR